MSDHPRDCPHGRQWGKCPHCDLIEANKHIAALESDVTLYRDRLAAVATEREALEAENVQLNQLSIDLRACMFEARHKWGLEQDKNDKLWAVAKAVGLVPVPQEHAGMVRIHSRDWWNIADALAALEAEVGE